MKKYIALALLIILLAPKSSIASLGDVVAAPINFAADVTADAVDASADIAAGAVATGVGVAEGAVDTAADAVSAPFEYPTEYEYDDYEGDIYE